MTDTDFLEALESCTLSDSEFGHAGHVRAGYLYLRSMDYATALVKIRAAIRNYAASLGKPDRYHETITAAYLALIQEHLIERGDGGGWTGFVNANPELFEPETLLRFYSASQLRSALARRIFVLPRPPNASVGQQDSST